MSAASGDLQAVGAVQSQLQHAFPIYYDTAFVWQQRHQPAEQRRPARARAARDQHVALAPRNHGLQEIDYLSIDEEGAERAVLGSLDFDEFDIAAHSIENSRPGRESYDGIMDPAGYRQVAVLGVDKIWVRQSVLSQDPWG